jgi:hypothetical protein
MAARLGAVWFLACLGGAAGLARAQNAAIAPPVCTTLPGNAAMSLPWRWSHGTLQVFVDPPLLPTSLVGQTITGLWLRRPTLPGDGAYAPITRTLTVRGAFQQPIAASMVGTLTQNRPANATVLFGPAPVSSLAAPAPGPTTTVGADLLHVVFTTPLPVVAGTLYLEFETSDAPLAVSADHWVDAVWMPGAVDQGLVVAVGDGSCTTRPEPTRLRWTSPGGPVVGATAQLQVSGAPPTSGTSAGFVMAWVGLDPETRGLGAGYLGFGAPFATIDPALAGCHQWAPFDVSWLGPTDPTGTFATTFTIPTGAALGMRLGMQAAWLDPLRTGLPFSFSNGLAIVVGSAGIEWRCNSLFFPAAGTTSPWPPFVGQMPVLRFDY